MSEDALIRLTNLKALGHGPKELVQLVGNTYPYWRDLLAGDKSFGEKAARNIETKLGLPRGTLDSVDSISSGASTSRLATIDQALETLAAWVQNSDDLTRDQVKPLLNKMFDEPKRSQEIVARISATISASPKAAQGTLKFGTGEKPGFLP